MWCFSVKHKNHFPWLFWHDLCNSLLLPHVTQIFFAIDVESSSMIIVDMRDSVVSATNMSSDKLLSSAFELPPPIHPTVMLVHLTCYFIHFTLFAITSLCPVTEDLFAFCPYQNTMPWSAVICYQYLSFVNLCHN